MKNKMKNFVTFLIALVLALCVCGCGAKVDSGQGNEGQNQGGAEENQGQNQGGVEENQGQNQGGAEANQEQDGIRDFFPEIYSWYGSFGEETFAKLKINSIDETTYTYYGEQNFVEAYGHIFIVECTVEEDFYGVIESGTVIRLPIMGYHNDVEVFRAWLVGMEYCFSYFKSSDDVMLIDDEKGNKVKFMYFPCEVQQYQLIPIIEDKVDFDYIIGQTNYRMYKLLRHYSDYLAQGMTVEEASENLRKLKEDVDEYQLEHYHYKGDN